jgi:hypothetical protein
LKKLFLTKKQKTIKLLKSPQCEECAALNRGYAPFNWCAFSAELKKDNGPDDFEKCLCGDFMDVKDVPEGCDGYEELKRYGKVK